MAPSEKNRPASAPSDHDDRRRHNRVDMNLKARVLAGNGQETPCLVVNVSAGGAMLKAKTPPTIGEKVVLYIDSIGRFEGQVVRAGKHSFAVDYRSRRSKTKRTADQLLVALHASSRHHPTRRAAPRIRQDSPAFIRLESGEEMPCSILDISLTGASLEIDPRPPLGANLTVGKMAAKVVRRHDTGVGVIFTGSAQKMDDVIDQASSQDGPGADGADLAHSFGKKGA